MNEVIRVKNLSKTFEINEKESGLKGYFKSLFSPKKREINAVNNISFDLKEGEIVAFIGPNGAGKSTTLKILSGILFPSLGEVNVLGLVPWEKREKLSYKIGTVFGQRTQLWYHLPPIDTFRLFGKIYEIPEKEFNERLNFLSNYFEINNFINIPVRKLSLGQRMRAEFVLSLLHKPKVLYLDEPTIGLDIVAKKKLRELIKKINKEEKISIIFTSHDMQDVEKVCERAIVINNGKIIYRGIIAEIKKQFLKRKIIEVMFEKEVEKINFPNIGTLKINNFNYKLEIDLNKNSIKEVLDFLLSNYEVEDLTVSDPPIEEIIEEIFKSESK